MAKNYLNKTTVTYRFKLQVLKLAPGKLQEQQKRQLWDIYLKKMYINGLISEYSQKTWIYPIKELS